MFTHTQLKMYRVILHLLGIIIFSILLGCYQESPQQVVRTTHLSPKADSLFRVIKNVEHNNVFALRKAANEMALIENDSNATVIAAYYSIKADYYSHITPEVLEKLEAFYKKVYSKDLEFIRLEIDIILAIYYRHEDISKHVERVNLATKYILNPEYSSDLDLIIAILTPTSHDELLKIDKKYKNKEWNFLLSLLYPSLIRSYNNLGNKDEATKLLLFALNNNIKYNFVDRACSTINTLTNIDHNIERQQKAIDLSIQSGITHQLDIYYRVLGHCYADIKQFDNALASYQNTLHQDSLKKNTVDIAGDLGHYAFIFALKNKNNIHEAFSIFDKALNILPKDNIIQRKFILERQIWSIESHYGKNAFSKFGKYFKKSKSLDSLYMNEIKKQEIDVSQLNAMLKIKGKNNEIKLLSFSNEINRSRQRLIIAVSLLLLLGISSLLYYYKRRGRTLKEIESKNLIIENQNTRLNNLVENLSDRNKVIEDQNTELKDLVTKLKQSNELLENFAQVAAHDLKAPLRTMGSFSMHLRQKHANSMSENDLRMFDFVISGAKDLTNIINDLLTFSTLTQNLSPPNNINLANVTQAVEIKLTELLKGKKANLVQKTIPSNIVAHPNLIEQLFLNLISNSIKYGKPNAENTITIGHKIYNNDFYLISISDTGIGIPKEKHTDVFQLFRKLHPASQYEGSGIGLATCKKIVNHYGGDIWIESEENEGTTVFFTLPIEKN